MAMNLTPVWQKLALALALTVALPAAATGICEIQLQADIRHSIAAVESPLPDSYLQILANHPIAQLGRRSEGGKELTFYNIYLDPNADTKQNKGETLQSHFLAQILKAAFPQAGHGDHVIELIVQDTMERQQYANPRKTIEMMDLKAANPAGYDINRAKARERFNVPASMKVLSIYVQSLSMPTLAAAWPALIEDLRHKYDFDLIVLSSNKAVDRVPPEFTEAMATPLSKWQNDPKHPFYGTVVFNDTVGQMPWIHAMANAAFVAGAINFFEPLVVGTPTVIIVNHEFQRSYDTKAFTGMANQAVETGGAFLIGTLDQAAGRLDKMAERPNAQILLPGLSKGPTGKTAFKTLLDDLELYLRAQGVGA